MRTVHVGRRHWTSSACRSEVHACRSSDLACGRPSRPRRRFGASGRPTVLVAIPGRMVISEAGVDPRSPLSSTSPPRAGCRRDYTALAARFRRRGSAGLVRSGGSRSERGSVPQDFAGDIEPAKARSSTPCRDDSASCFRETTQAAWQSKPIGTPSLPRRTISPIGALHGTDEGQDDRG